MFSMHLQWRKTITNFKHLSFLPLLRNYNITKPYIIIKIYNFIENIILFDTINFVIFVNNLITIQRYQNNI